MLSDRSYMRGDYRPERTSIVTWLMCALAGAFVLEFAADSRWSSIGPQFAGYLALTIEGLAAGHIWTIATHWLVHSTSNLLHIGLVLLVLFLVGRELADELGPKRFLAAFISSVVGGALVWIAANWRTGGELIGTTAGIYGLVTIFALRHPQREVTFLLFFFFPVAFRFRQFLVAMIALETAAFALIHITGQQLPFAYAPSAHLGAMLAGWLYFRLRESSAIHQTKRLRGRALAPTASAGPAADEPGAGSPSRQQSPSPEELRREIDRILDKISSHGLAALTPEERRRLDNARDLLNRR